MRRIAMVLLSVLVAGAALMIALGRGDRRPALTPAPAPAAVTAVSPVFGVNMSLYDGNDELATSPGTQAMLRSWGVPLIRVPMRAGLPDATLTRALQAVLAVGATPMVILHGPKSGTVAQNQHLLSLVHEVFGEQLVYLEYGNEQDLAGVDASDYVAGWNAVIPALKQAAPAAYRFVGPVNFQADPGYVAAFVAGARPAPDFVSWHEYVCNAGNSDRYCTEHIAGWAEHATAVEEAIRAAVGHTIPFFVSEWNLDPNDTPRYGNAGFIQPWTRAALTQLLDLVPAGLAGAMLYTATNHGNFGLVNGGTPTQQGSVFRDVLTAGPPVTPAAPAAVSAPTSAPAGNLAGGQQPTAGNRPTASGRGSDGGGSTGGASGQGSGQGSSASGSGGSAGGGATGGSTDGGSTGGPTTRASFESGMNGWDEYWGYSNLSLSRTGGVHYDGGNALKMTAASTDYVAAGTQSNLSGLRSGSTVAFHVYASGGGGRIRPFVMDPSSTVHWPQGERALPSSSGWFTLTFTVPAGMTVHAIGLQLKASSGGVWIALDALSW